MKTRRRPASHQPTSSAGWLFPIHVARRLSISRDTVYRLLRRGEFPGAIKVGRRQYRVPETAIKAYIEANAL